MKEITHTAIVGMGALGMLFGSIIMEHLGPDSVSFVMDEERLERHKEDVYKINGKPVEFRKISSAEAMPCDLLLVAVKYTGLAEALDVMNSSVGPETIIISLLNGIDSEEIIGARYGEDRIIHAVAQGMDAMHFGSEVVYTKPGQLRIGITDPAKQQILAQVTSFFDRSGVPYAAEADIMQRLWSKFMVNVGVNQTCMVYGVGYGKAMEHGSAAYMTLVGAMREVVLLAAAEGIALSEKDIIEYIALLKTFDPEATPSMGQDWINRRPSEVEMFAGKILKLAKKHQIPVPANEFLYRRVHEIEKEYVNQTQNL